MLCAEGVFGDASRPLKDQLGSAYKDFRKWCRQEKVNCSQPLFTPKLAPLLNSLWSF